jgi:hypothetical protein
MIKTNNTTNLKLGKNWILLIIPIYAKVSTSIFSKLFIKSVKFKIFTNAVISQPFFLMVFFVLFPKT